MDLHKIRNFHLKKTYNLLLGKIIKKIQPWISEQFLAIHFNETSVHGILARRGLLGNEIIKWAQTSFSAGNNEKHNEGKTLAFEMEKFIYQFFPTVTNFILLLDAKYVVIRDIKIPDLTADEDIRLVTQLAIENLLNLPIETIEVIGQGRHVTSGKEATQLQVLTFTSKHDDLLKAAKPLQKKHYSIKMITTESVALASYLQSLSLEIWQRKHILQIDIGIKSLVINILNDRSLIYSRMIPIHITMADPLAEIARTLFASGDQIPKFDKIYLSGCNPQIKKLKKELVNLFSRPVEDYPHSYHWQEKMDPWIKTIGLTYHYFLSKSNQLNFLIGKFGEKMQGTVFDWKVFKKPVMAIAIIVTIFLISIFVQVIYEKKQISNYQEKIKELAANIPSLQDSRDIETIFVRLKSICQQQDNNQNQDAKVLNILYQLTNSVPTEKEIKLEFNRFQYSKSGVEIDVILENIAQANELEGKLKKSESFATAELIERKLIPPKQKVRMRLLLGLKKRSISANDCQVL